MRPVHHVTHSGAAGQDTDERLVPACPQWCDHDEKIDTGTPEEFVIHCGAERYIGSMRLQLRQVMFVDGALEPPVLLIGEDELPVSEAAHLTTALAATAAEATGDRHPHAIAGTRATVDDISLLYPGCIAC